MEVSRSLAISEPGKFSGTKPRIRIGWSMVKLADFVLADIIRSNVAVGRIIPFRPAARRSGFIRLPVTLESRYALGVSAMRIHPTGQEVTRYKSGAISLRFGW